jgi:hypothetical protein
VDKAVDAREEALLEGEEAPALHRECGRKCGDLTKMSDRVRKEEYKVEILYRSI